MSRRLNIHISVTCIDSDTGRVEDATAKILGNLVLADVQKVREVLLPFQAKLEELNTQFLAADMTDDAAA